MRSWKLCAALLVFAAALAPLRAHVRIGTRVTWDREVAPIVEARCVTCHREGGRAPMSLASYEEARPWAKAIKEEVLTRRMPRWHVVRGYGDFANDPSLSAFEIALIASWADGGAPKTLAGVKPHAAPAPSSATKPTKTRIVSVPCAARSVPSGPLVALKPVLAQGESVRISLLSADGSEEPLIWLKDFEPEFAETYWLRTPVTVTRGMRMLTDTNKCSVELTYLPATARSAAVGAGVRTDR